MDSLFAERIRDVPRSFIREILKDALQPGAISFAGGLPNPKLFPIDALKQASDLAFAEYGNDLFQYSESEGFTPLRQLIVERYRQQGLAVKLENVLITNGSQQGLDLLGKILIDKNDALIIEEPGYLGAIQAFSLFQPKYCPVPVSEQGMNCEALAAVLKAEQAKLIYIVPNFQNPSGITYSNSNRREMAHLIEQTNCLLIEDNPYGELRFSGEHQQSFATLLPEQCVLLGTFSKTVVPGFRLGWIVAPDRLLDKLVTAKQAADLHTNQLVQCIVFQYLRNNSLDEHIHRIVEVYGRQKDAMITAMEKYFPENICFTRPEGGMFLWASLPENVSALELFHRAAKEKVLFVPGDPFYINKSNVNTLRLNFTCVDPQTIDTGIEWLGRIIRQQS